MANTYVAVVALTCGNVNDNGNVIVALLAIVNVETAVVGLVMTTLLNVVAVTVAPTTNPPATPAPPATWNAPDAVPFVGVVLVTTVA